jgi:hypothetical protein
MFAADRAPRYVEETAVMAARLQERTTPAQYAALAARAGRLLEGLFTIDVHVPPDVQLKIALREKFDPARTKQAILMVATWRLLQGFALGKRSIPSTSTAPAISASARPALEAVLGGAAR